MNVSLYLDRKGNIQFVASDCPDKVCVNTGKMGTGSMRYLLTVCEDRIGWNF